MEGDQSHNPNNDAVVAAEGQPTPSNEAPAKAPSNESADYPKPPYTPIDVQVKEVKYSEKSKREYTSMWISEEDHNYPKSSLPHKVELLVRSLMELFLSDSIIRKTRRHTNERVREKADSFSAVSDSYIYILILFITWGLSCFRPSFTIGTPEVYGEITSHAPTFHFIDLIQCGKTSTSPQLTRRIH